MLSATPMPTDSLEVDPSLLNQVDSDNLVDVPVDLNSLEGSAPGEPTFELIFVDTHLRDYELLLDGLVDDQPGRDFEVVLLDESQDGVEQIGEQLAKFSDVDAVHIFSHGSQDGVQLGSTWLRMGTLDDYADDLSDWGQSLSADADLLFYGCEAAATDAGQALLSAIQDLTGADVAASTDNTGHSDYGGDWQLEFTEGTVETTIAMGGRDATSLGSSDGDCQRDDHR